MQEQTDIHDDSGTTVAAIQPEMSMEFSHTEVKIEDIMTATVISVSPDQTVSAAIWEMATYRISCVIVTAGGKAVGILTERDVLRGVATRYDEFVRATIAEEMSKPVVSVCPKTTTLRASKLMAARKIKRLLVVDEQQPVGVVTQTDIASALIAMAPFRNIADLMTGELVWVHETTTLVEAAQIMAAKNISCVVVLQAGRAVGVVTEKDILQRVARNNRECTEVYVGEIMSSPVVSVPPTHSVMSASRVMDQMRIHRLLIGSPTEVQGIVTQTDIIAAVQKKLEDTHRAQLQRELEIAQLLESAITDLSSIQYLLGGILSHHESVGESAKRTEHSVDAPSDRSALYDGEQEEAAWYGRTLGELKNQVLATQDRLARLAAIVGVRVSRKSTLTIADNPLDVSEMAT